MFVLLALVACSSANEELANEPVLPILEEPAEPAGPGGFGALISGKLVVADRCLYLENESGGRVFPVFAYDSVSWERDTLVLHGQKFKIGERLSLGGGERDINHFRFFQEPHESCDVRNVVIINDE
jgi:hypothetical protein